MWTEWWSDLRYRLRAIARRGKASRELDDELAFHLARETERYQRQGLPLDEARRQARLAFGGLEDARERSRDAWGTALVESVMQDVRYAVRALRSRPIFSVGVGLTLALGIGANTAMLDLVDRMFFRPPSYLADADRVHRVYLAQTFHRAESLSRFTSVGRYLDVQRWTHSFSSVAASATWRVAVGDGEATRELPVMGATTTYFELFDAKPALGRFFQESDDRLPTGSPVAVLGFAHWLTAFGGQPDVLGRQIRIGRTLFTVIGVAPRGFTGLGDADDASIYIPFAAFTWNARPADHTSDYHWQWLEIAAKRKPGVTVAAATADLTDVLERSWIAAGTTVAERAEARPRAILGPVQVQRGPQAASASRVAIWVGGVAAIVLLIACANVANLLLTRAITRRREIAMRLALGVSRGRLVRQLFIESLALAFIGGAGALLVAQWARMLMGAVFRQADVPTSSIADARTVAAIAITTIVVAFVTGLGPVLHALRTDLSQASGAGGRQTDGRVSRARTLLLAAQVTLTVVLLIGAGLFVRSLERVRGLRLGFDVDPIVLVSEKLRAGQPSRDERRPLIALEQTLAEAAAALPGVVAATPAPTVPFWGYEGRSLAIETAGGVENVDALGNFILQAGNADYFKTMGTRILRGRGFDPTDRAGAPAVVVVSEAMASALWAGRDPVGQCLHIEKDHSPCASVVGVAEDTRTQSLDQPHEYTYYVPIAQYPDATGTLLVRVAGHAEDFAASLRQALQPLMPANAYLTVEPFQRKLDSPTRSWRLGATMFVAFGGLALIVAAVGLYSVMAYGVAQRRREIGIRLALGATREHVVGLVVRGGLGLVLASVGLGSAIALVAGPSVEPLLFHVSATDPLVYATVAGLCLLVALGATWMPSRAAARVDPNLTLKAE